MSFKLDGEKGLLGRLGEGIAEGWGRAFERAQRWECSLLAENANRSVGSGPRGIYGEG